MRIWFDTEFIEDGKTIDLISIGLVREDGAELYLESAECDLMRADPWVTEHVVSKLTMAPHQRVLRAEIASRIRVFAGERPEFWAYYADYDWIALCQLFGRMLDLPKGWPMWCRDLKQYADFFRLVLPDQVGVEHHALADAKWTREAHLWAESFVAQHPGRGMPGWLDAAAGVSTVTWRELLALAHDDPTAHGHLTMWRLGKLGDAEMLARLAAAQTQRVRELTAKCVQLMERAGPAVVATGGDRTEPGP